MVACFHEVGCVGGTQRRSARLDEEHREVQIRAIGVKEGNRLLLGGEEVEL
jgi:hypothetical protein